MVKSVQYTDDVLMFRNAFENSIDRIGKTHTITRYTITTDGFGDVLTTTSTTFDIKGDFQIIDDLEEIEKLGVQANGSAKFFAKIGTNIEFDDEITVNNVVWQFKQKIEDNELNGVAVAQSWLLVRLDG